MSSTDRGGRVDEILAPRADGPDDDVPDLRRFFAPRSMVVFGSVPKDPGTIERHRRFGCPVAIVNPKGGSSDIFPVYRSISEVPGEIDLAMVRTAPATAIELLEQCGQRGIPFALVYSAGFSEVGTAGAELEEKLGEVARRYGVRLMGPNTNENAFERLGVPEYNRGGLIGLITQSGHNGRPIVQGSVIGAAFSRWVPTGNEVDLEAAHFLRYFAEDEQTRCIAAYIEGFRSIGRLRDALQRANEADKPVVMLKIGATRRGAATAVSHTGHLTGADAVTDGLFRQHGVTRVFDLDQLLETSNLLAKMPAGIGPRAALYSISGGSGTLMAEVAESFGIEIPELSAETQAKLHELIPTYLTVRNPIDNGGPFVISAPPEDRLRVLDIIAADPEIDYIVVGLTGAIGLMTDNFGADLMRWAPTAPKPVIATWNSFKTDEPGYERLVRSGVAVFRSFTNCFSALSAYAEYQRRRSSFRRRPPISAPGTQVQELLAQPGVLSGERASRLLDAVGITVACERHVVSAAEAAEAAAAFGRPVVMKLLSAAFPHKSDAGLVRLGVADGPSAAAVFDDLMARARQLDGGAPIEGVLVQEQVSSGIEMIIGLSRDAAAGTVLTIGAGGIYAEILDDVAVRPLPVDEQDVREMIGQLKVSALLAGARSAVPANGDDLVKLALAAARLGGEAAERLAELDLNPVIVTPERAVVVDVLAVAS